MFQSQVEIEAFSKDLLPSCRIFTERLLAVSPCFNAMDIAKNLLELKCFYTIDHALVVGYIFQYILSNQPPTEDSLPTLLSGLLSFTTLDQNPSVDFCFGLLGKTDENDLSYENFSQFMDLHSLLFREDPNDKRPHLVSFVFKKSKHQAKSESVHQRLLKMGSLLEHDREEDFRESMIALYRNDEVFRTQLKCLYSPIRTLTIWMVSNIAPEAERGTSFNSEQIFKLFRSESNTSVH